MSLKLNENEVIRDGKLTISESFDVSTYETSQKQIITESTGEKRNKLVLNPTIEAIHAGRTRNGNIYTPEKLRGNFEKKSGVYSFTSPYPKPMLKNHDHGCEPTGRITHAEFSNNSAAGKPCITIKPEITDPDAIEKVLDGRYMTVSIGATTDEAICNICGTDILKDGFCGHFRNETYDGVTCGWICGELYFDECSWVNVPSCTTAITTNVGEVTTKESVEADKGIESEDEENMASNENKEQTVEDTEENIENQVEDNVEEGTEEDQNEGSTTENDNVSNGTNNIEDNEQDNGVEENNAEKNANEENGEENQENSVGATNEENTTPTAGVQEGLDVSEKLTKLEERAVNAEKSVKEKNIEISNLNVEINEIREEYDMAQAQLVKVQENNINILASTIVEFKETLNDISTSEKEEELSKLKGQTEETLVEDFHGILTRFKEEAKKRLYSGSNTDTPFNRNIDEGANKPLTESEKQQLREKALKALFKGQVKR